MTDGETMDDWAFNAHESLIKEIEDGLDYGDSRSRWIRDACREKLEREKYEQTDH